MTKKINSQKVSEFFNLIYLNSVFKTIWRKTFCAKSQPACNCCTTVSPGKISPADSKSLNRTPKSETSVLSQKKKKTRMHSSRMRTARSLTVSRRIPRTPPPPAEQPRTPREQPHMPPPRATTHAPPQSNHARPPPRSNHVKT